jgi:hypothetical protein
LLTDTVSPSIPSFALKSYLHDDGCSPGARDAHAEDVLLDCLLLVDPFHGQAQQRRLPGTSHRLDDLCVLTLGTDAERREQSPLSFTIVKPAKRRQGGRHEDDEAYRPPGELRHLIPSSNR